jgi:hypothetical protein
VEDQLDAGSRRRARDEGDVVLVLAGVDHDAALEDLVAREHDRNLREVSPRTSDEHEVRLAARGQLAMFGTPDRHHQP